MPTRQTNLVSETGGDAAGRGLGLAVALKKDATHDVSPLTDAARPTAASTRSLLGLLERYWRAFQERRQRLRLRASLHHLSDRQLQDIGVTRAEIDCIAAHRAIDRLRDGTTDPWIMSRGVM
ncbi:MAG TPA: DUF1127 domain-containing protein [Bradyrhizobium sp.]|nr:DUF1127 domain-containing protein [Bradyrhizobium sp.]